MWVTLYTDASYKNDKGRWAFWAKSDQGRMVVNGDCPDHIKDSHAAEAYAIYKGLKAILDIHTGVVGVHINSDCLSLKNAFFPWGKASKNMIVSSIQKETKELIKSYGIKIRFSHVKAHQLGTDVRTYLNNACDTMAGKR
jgi:ribonuclease HI